jgi:hypothetical protein
LNMFPGASNSSLCKRWVSHQICLRPYFFFVFLAMKCKYDAYGF